MSIAVKLRCSECATIREADLKAEERDIICPVCARRIQNLTAAEHSEVESVQKKQRLFGIIAIVFFIFTSICIVMWIGGSSAWVSGKQLTADGKIIDAAGPIEAQASFFFGAIVCGLVTLVLGILGSMKRFVVEF